MSHTSPEPGRLLRTGEVAAVFRVHPKTVSRWAKNGKLPASSRTLGGHARFRESEVRALLAGVPAQPAPKGGGR